MTYEVWLSQETTTAILRSIGVNISSGTYETERGGEELGIVGAVLARLDVPDESIGLAVDLAVRYGYNVIEVSHGGEIERITPPEPVAKQLAATSIILQAPYNETSHLTPDGRRRRR